MKKAAIILGGGLNPDGSLPEHVSSRLKLCSAMDCDYSFILFSSRYTLNKRPVLDSKGFIITEAAAMAKKYVSEYSPEHHVFLELFSTDTIGSALNCRSIIDNLGIIVDEVDVITSDWHELRARYIFEWAFTLAGYSNVSPKINTVAAPFNGELPTKRMSKELSSLNFFKNNWLSIKHKTDAWVYLLKNHDNYNLHNCSTFVSCNTGSYLY